MRRLLFLCFALAALLPLASNASGEFLHPDQAFRLSTAVAPDGALHLEWQVSDGYYLYRKQMKLVAKPSDTVLAPAWPAGEVLDDPTFGKSEVYRQRVAVSVRPVDAKAVEVTWQGCADAGICYPPQTRLIDLPGGGSAVAPAPGTAAPVAAAPDEDIAAQLARAGLPWMVSVFFGLGLLMTLTPCVLPMVPILSGLIAGSGGGTARHFRLSLAYVLPMAATYALAGAGAALAGANVQAALQHPAVIIGFSLVFVLLAMSMFGLYELQLPAFIRQRLDAAGQDQRGGTLAGAAAMGVLSALLVGPCMTAPLAGALLYIGNTGDALTGAAVLFAMGLGMGVPLLLVGTLGGKVLPRPGMWMERVKQVFGFVLLGTAIWFAGRVLGDEASRALWGAWLVAIAVAMTAHRIDEGCRRSRLGARYVGLLAGIVGATLVAASVGVHAGGTLQQQASSGGAAFTAGFTRMASLADLESRVAEAGGRGQWTMVDFDADWCISCDVIERTVFADPRVQQALSGMQLLRADVTANSEDNRTLMKTHGVLGPPTFLFIGPDGVERRAARIVGELDADEFLERLAQAKGEAAP